MAARHRSPFVPGHAAVAKKTLGQDEIVGLELDTALYILTGSWAVFGSLGAYYAFDAGTTFGYISGFGLSAFALAGLINFFGFVTT